MVRAERSRSRLCRWTSGAAAATVVATMLAAPPALAAPAHSGKVIDVYPGEQALSNALAAALEGDTLRVHTGTYPEAITIATPHLKIVTAADGKVIIDGGCDDIPATIAVEANGTTIDGRAPDQLEIHGGDDGVLFDRSGSLRFATVARGCDSLEDRGVLVTSLARRVWVTDSQIYGHDDGISVIGVTEASARVILARNSVSGLYNGIMLSSSRSATIDVRSNLVRFTLFEAILVIGTNDAVIRGNTVHENDGNGIHVTDASNNLIAGNMATGNGTDLLQEDARPGNCFIDNTYETSDGWVGCVHSG